jgi:uncharacterized YigZ family protein
MENDSYLTIKHISRGDYKEKGSHFISTAFPVNEVAEIKQILEGIRKENFEARHHCYAYMLGNERITWRVNDDGEPSGTAGRPILGQINSYGLTNILIVVSRYFGGTLLGVSGLINAYRSAAASAIEHSEIIEKKIQYFYDITFPYISMNQVMKILKDEEIKQSESSFDLTCRIQISFRVSKREKILKRFERVEGLKFLYLKTQ